MADRKANFFDSKYVPQSLEDLYNSGWKEYLIYHISRYALNDVNNSVEDLLQDMMVQMAKTKFIEKYDPERTEFIKYLKTFIRNFMSKVYHREHDTKNGEKIINAAGIVNSPEEVEESSGNVVCSEALGESSGYEDYMCLVQSLEQDLEQIRSDSTVEYQGETFTRDPFTVYKLLSSGYDVKDIAEIFGTSKQFVYSLRKKLCDLIKTYA